MNLDSYCSEDLIDELERRVRTGSNLYKKYDCLPRTLYLRHDIIEYCTRLKKGSQRDLALRNPNIVKDQDLMWQIQSRIINGRQLTHTLLKRMIHKLQADPPNIPGKKLVANIKSKSETNDKEMNEQ